MKSFVRNHFILPEVAATIAWATVVLTHAGLAATYLICLGLLAVVVLIGMRSDWGPLGNERRLAHRRSATADQAGGGLKR
jgi:hypothetical protein